MNQKPDKKLGIIRSQKLTISRELGGYAEY